MLLQCHSVSRRLKVCDFQRGCQQEGAPQDKAGSKSLWALCACTSFPGESLTQQTNGEKKFEVQVLVFSALLVRAQLFHET